MKKLLSFALMLMLCLTLLPVVSVHTAAADDRYLEINETVFPDINFRNWIIDNLAVSGDAETGYYMTQAQTNSVTKIVCYGKAIQSMAGLEHFTKLQYLDCHTNQLAVLDVSRNTNLLNLFCDHNQLTALDVSKNGKLWLLSCQDNQLTALDVSQNTELHYLTCLKNQLTALDVSKNTAIVRLNCWGNQLTELDVSKNTTLEELICSSNGLRELDVSKNTSLQSLNCYNNQLTVLDVSKNTALIDLQCANNELTSLDVSKNTALAELHCNNNQLTALDVSRNKALEKLFCYNNLLTELDVSNNTALVRLYCYGNLLTELDVSKNTSLTYLICRNNELTALDVGKNPTLAYIDCTNNQLTALDVRTNTALATLRCSENHLRMLNVSHNTALTDFEANGQTVEDQKGYIVNRAYTYDLTQLISENALKNVTIPDETITLNKENGIVFFSSEVTEFAYQYNAAVDPNGGDIELPELPASIDATAKDVEPRMMEVAVYLTFEAAPAFDGTIEWNKEDVKFKGTTPYVVANGSAQTPRFTVKAADGTVIAASHYTYQYLENTNAGTAYVIVTFKDTYSGTARAFFKIYLPATDYTKVENRDDGIYIEWHAVEGAAGYVIYRRAWSSTTDGWTDFVRWNNTKDLHWTDTTVYAGTRYQYGIKAYFEQRVDPVTGVTIGGNVGDNYNLGEVGLLKTTVRITTRKLNSVTGGTKQITAKWSGSSVFTGYQVQVATDADFTDIVKTVKIAKANAYQTTVKNLNADTTYYVRVRSYHVFNGMTYYGGWSNVLSGKTK